MRNARGLHSLAAVLLLLLALWGCGEPPAVEESTEIMQELNVSTEIMPEPAAPTETKPTPDAPAKHSDRMKPEPVYPPLSTAAALAEALAPFEALDDAALLEAVPHTSGIVFIDSPATDKGAGGWQLFEWGGPEAPGSIRCIHSGVVFPNDTYPMTEVLAYQDGLGDPVEARYYPLADGTPAFFSLHADYLAKLGMAEAARNYAESWRLTGNPDHARRAALILGRFAEVFPRYVLWNSNPGRTEPIPNPVSEGETEHGMWSLVGWKIWSYQMIPDELLQAYDSLKGSDALDMETQQAVVREVFERSIQQQLQFKDRMTNADPHTYQSLILAGRILERPDLVDLSVARIGRFARENFFYDGFWKEGSVAYHDMAVHHLKKALSLLGAEDGDDPLVRGVEARFEAIDRARALLSTPGGLAVRVADDWGNPLAGALSPEGGLLWGGMGHARLGHGPQEKRIESHLAFSGGYGHGHADALALMLFAGPRELFPDLGYSWTILRPYTTGTMSHNTVMVDEKNSAWSQAPGGALQLFAGDPEGPMAVEATHPHAYPDLQDYRRRLIQVPFEDGAGAYVVDIFHVAGGGQHDYFLHGSADEPGAVETDLPMQPGPQSLAGEIPPAWPANAGDFGDFQSKNYFSLFRDTQRASADSSFFVSFSSGEVPTERVRTWFAGNQPSEVFLGRTPQVRPSDQDDSRVKDFWRPSMVLRRKPEDGISTFVAVHEPHRGKPQIQSIEMLQEPTPEQALVLRVTHTGGIDLIISSPQPLTTESDGVTMEGRLGVVRRDGANALQWVFQYDTPFLRVDDKEFFTHPPFEVSITGVEIGEDGLPRSLVVADLPVPPKEIQGGLIRITHAEGTVQGYFVDTVEPIENGFRLTTSPPPGFSAENGKVVETAFPNRTFEGLPTARFDRFRFSRP